MKISLKISALGLAAFGAVAIAAPAWAGCGAELPKTPAAYEYGDTGGARLIRVDNDQGFQSNRTSIVGLWNILLMSGGAVVDFGYSAWHSDGTEIMNSGGHPASTGNFCLGVWAQTGPNHYHLNHIALAYDPTKFNVPGDNTHAPGGYIARINLIEDIVLDPRANKFTGTFTQIGYDPITGAVIPMFGATGQITGQRVTP
jgi:hypothetical protein